MSLPNKPTSTGLIFAYSNPDKPTAEPEEMEAKVAAAHTMIVGQSGCGKSFFLGRIVEELLTKTKARCIIIDPNGDFRTIKQLDWRGGPEDKKQRWWLTEEQEDSFKKAWHHVIENTRIWPGDKTQEIVFPWLAVSTDLLFSADEVTPVQRRELYYCHKFVSHLAKLKKQSKAPVKKGEPDLLTKAEGLVRKRGALTENVKKYVDELGEGADKKDKERIWEPEKEKSLLYAKLQTTSETRRFYFGLAFQLTETDFFTMKECGAPDMDHALEIIDLPALQNAAGGDKAITSSVVGALLDNVWNAARDGWESAMQGEKEADERVPRFIVVDEAHNLMPAEPRSAADRWIRDSFRTIAAEGRKYGLFLVLVTQRPDKLDPLILSECGNWALMKSTAAVVEQTGKLLGMPENELAEQKLSTRVPKLNTREVFLYGKWTEYEPKFLYSAARRTEEGGRSLRPEFWGKRADNS